VAGEPGIQADHLAFFARVEREVRRFGIFALLRAAEARGGPLPRIGRSRQPAQNIADLAQTPSLAFPGPTIESLEPAPSGRVRVRSYFLGLTGPMGALPLHLTEYALYERRYAKTQPFGAFLDLITDRMLQFFYRAWADSQPAAQADRPADDHFAKYLQALTGAADGAGETGPFPARQRLAYAGLFSSRRSAAVLEDGLTRVLQSPVQVREFVGRWRELEPEDLTRLGGTAAQNRLGSGAMLGRRVLSAADTFRVIIQPANFEDYRSCLPGGARHAIASAAISALAPSHLDWELQLRISNLAIEPARLDGRAALGWTGWLTPCAEGGVRADARLRKTWAHTP
jgi:type VI secretion system protein ImpH